MLESQSDVRKASAQPAGPADAANPLPANPPITNPTNQKARIQAAPDVSREGEFVPVAGIGASAGGLEAFSELLSQLPPDTGMAFVFLSHLDPQHSSILGELLAKETSMPVIQVEGDQPVAPNTVYVLPPNKVMTISDSVLRLEPRVEERHRSMVVDVFLKSLADDQQNRAIGVVLSGTATDGTVGLRAVKAEGGITFAQSPESAKYDGMPRSAIAAGCVDCVLPPAGIAREVAIIARHPYLAPGTEAEPAEARPQQQFAQLLHMLKAAHGVDFSYYKQSTIRRRILRRMLLSRVETVDAYLDRVRDKPEELDRLLADLLINVTSFFRDPEAFEALKDRVFPAILASRRHDSPIRIWSPGCSTGEEVYSLAICLLEYLDERSTQVPIQIFGTDISESAIEKARTGVYSEHAMAEVEAGRRRRFFVQVEGGYQINPSIREMCVFARHDVTRDPPFSRLDLVSCRNVLIYLGEVLQKRILRYFHYALNPGGYLFLGASETVGTLGDLFSPADRRNRIYQRKPAAAITLDFPLGEAAVGTHEAAGNGAEHKRGIPEVQREADRAMLSRYAPPGVVIDDRGNVLQFRGRTGLYLEPAPGEASHNLLKMAREGLLIDLRAAVEAARRKNGLARREGVRVRSNGGFRVVDIEVSPIKGLEGMRHFLVVFLDTTPREVKGGTAAAGKGKAVKAGDGLEVQRLREELEATRQYLQAIIEEQEATNEELQSASEETQSSNEELQSANEELQTAKEELQSTNEELTTVNEELLTRNTELTQLNNDLSNLLASASIAIVMLSGNLRIRRFTPMAEKLLNLIPADIGRSIFDIKPNIEIPDLERVLIDVLETLTVEEREVRDRDGVWYNLIVRPYKTRDNKIDGAVMALVNIDAPKRALEEARQTRDFAQAIFQTVREPLVVLDENLRVSTANRAFYSMFGHTPETIGSTTFFELEKGEWNLPAVRKLIEEAQKGGDPTAEVEIEQKFRRIGYRRMLLNARRITRGGPDDSLILVAAADISEQVRTGEIHYGGLFRKAPDPMLLVDFQTGRIIEANDSAIEWLGYPKNELQGKKFWEIPAFSEAEAGQFAFQEAKEKGRVLHDAVTLRTKTGQLVRAEIRGRVWTEGAPRTIQFRLSDVTERVWSEQNLTASMREKDAAAREMHHRLKNNLQVIASLLSLQTKYLAEGLPARFFLETRNRVRAMATVHDMLHPGGGTRGDAAEYIEKIAENLVEFYEADPDRIGLQIKVNPLLTLPVEKTLPCGLIINELLSNALKHAFPGGRKGKITVELRSPDDLDCELTVRDDGVGLPAGFEPREAQSLGLQLVNLLAEQLGGRFEFQSDQGTTFRVIFPIYSRK